VAKGCVATRRHTIYLDGRCDAADAKAEWETATLWEWAFLSVENYVELRSEDSLLAWQMSRFFIF
jgi:hypothetical protein